MRWSVVAVCLLAGCAVDRPDAAPGDGTGPGWERSGRGEVEIPQIDPPPGVEAPTPEDGVEGDVMRGDMGDVLDFEAAPHTIRADTTEGWALIEIFVQDGPERHVMVAIVVEGGLEHPALDPGASLRFASWDLRDPDALDLDIGVLGCSGPEAGLWLFDVFAKDVTVNIHVGETPDQRIAEFDATFDDGRGDQRVEGSFTYYDRVP